jgi:hypothetical protein
MNTNRRSAADLLDVTRALLLLQGAILVATTIEALVWSLVLAGAGGAPILVSAAAAAVIFTARARLRADRRWSRRLVYGVEGLTLATVAIDMALAIALTGALPPAVALLTRVVLPMSVIALLRRSAAGASSSVVALKGVS